MIGKKLSLASILIVTSTVLGGCNPYWLGGTAVLLGPPAITGRSTAYNIDKYFGRECEEFSYFDRPTRCVNPKNKSTARFWR